MTRPAVGSEGRQAELCSNPNATLATAVPDNPRFPLALACALQLPAETHVIPLSISTAFTVASPMDGPSPSA